MLKAIILASLPLALKVAASISPACAAAGVTDPLQCSYCGPAAAANKTAYHCAATNVTFDDVPDYSVLHLYAGLKWRQLDVADPFQGGINSDPPLVSSSPPNNVELAGTHTGHINFTALANATIAGLPGTYDSASSTGALRAFDWGCYNDGLDQPDNWYASPCTMLIVAFWKDAQSGADKKYNFTIAYEPQGGTPSNPDGSDRINATLKHQEFDHVRRSNGVVPQYVSAYTFHASAPPPYFYGPSADFDNMIFVRRVKRVT